MAEQTHMEQSSLQREAWPQRCLTAVLFPQSYCVAIELFCTEYSFLLHCTPNWRFLLVLKWHQQPLVDICLLLSLSPQSKSRAVGKMTWHGSCSHLRMSGESKHWACSACVEGRCPFLSLRLLRQSSAHMEAPGLVGALKWESADLERRGHRYASPLRGAAVVCSGSQTEQGGAQHPQWTGSQCLVLWSRGSPEASRTSAQQAQCLCFRKHT